ncbi:hypothetical protein [Modicisalibacter sp. MOD 31.J]|uniref:hypothetical protein n=1 Tax=Modicisalibacter sp. MOD 31.J TaxID=2831897 RepID=UPI001CCEE2B7|nr:hypothetical protein [Modicisalibacter sp. MOD 31.J]MBZ9574519.1 hypothetical protein [Modicisalibacter sp. MOD 31.J]
MIKAIYLTDEQYRAVQCLVKSGTDSLNEYLSDTKDPRMDGYSDEEVSDLRQLAKIDPDALLDVDETLEARLIGFDEREKANILMALRVVQWDTEQGLDYNGHMSLDLHTALSAEEIDDLCVKIND